MLTDQGFHAYYLSGPGIPSQSNKEKSSLVDDKAGTPWRSVHNMALQDTDSMRVLQVSYDPCSKCSTLKVDSHNVPLASISQYNK